MLKRIVLSLILLFGILNGTSMAASVNVNLTIGQTIAWVGGQSTNLQVAPFETTGVTYVPIRFVGEALGVQVDWDAKNKGVIFTSNKHKIAMFINSKKIIFDGSEKAVTSMPQLKGSYTMVPLRIISELFEANVDYNPLGRVITIKATEPPVAQFDVTPDTIYVGESVQYNEYSYDPDGDSLIDWQWDGKKDTFDTPGTYTVRLRVKDAYGRWSPWAERTVTVNEIPNNPPQAIFSVNRTDVAQGETVLYTESSYDTDGDKIVDYQWTGKKPAFFAAGDYNVSLKVKDEKGAWSEPYTVTIHVSDQVLMNEYQYNLANPVAGAAFPLLGISDKDFTNLQPQTQDDGSAKLFYSNSPETVTSNGVLYADTMYGRIRLMYHHRNVTEKRKRFYLIARNTSDEPVVLKYIKGGYSGPSKDDFRVGQLGLKRFFESYYDRSVVIPAHQWMTINIGSNELVAANPGESIYGLYEVETSQSLKFMSIALDEGKSLEAAMPTLPNLNRDIHSRGTFDYANRNMSVNATANTRFIIGDGKQDLFMMGYDALSNQVTQNHGNYGVIYNIDINADRPLAVVANPRGGGFAGTFVLNGNVFFAPSFGGFAFNTTGMATMLGTINGHAQLTFIPPASSNLPINIDFLPLN